MGDYTRVLAEFWADGPDFETPPGHWFVILNAVNDHEKLVRRIGGKGPLLDPLAWDAKAYFALGGAMHDAAIAAWGIKGWYDYIRPISALRYQDENGQSARRGPAVPVEPAGHAGTGDPVQRQRSKGWQQARAQHPAQSLLRRWLASVDAYPPRKRHFRVTISLLRHPVNSSSCMIATACGWSASWRASASPSRRISATDRGSRAAPHRSATPPPHPMLSPCTTTIATAA